MKYQFSKAVRDNDMLRASFNALTRQTFGFDFEDWYASGHWGDWYIPNVLLDGDKVVSNVSVNLIQFDVQGTKKNYIQLGTVMTHEAYRGQGLNRKIMERILEEYAGKVDGIYLFGNDDVLEYYPKFGFRPSREYEYYLPCEGTETPYIIERIDMTCPEQCEKLYDMIRNYPNPNDGMYMNENLSLYQFWLAAGFGEHVYYLPENRVCVIAERDGEVLRIHQIFGQEQVNMMRLAEAFRKNEKELRELVLGYTPVHKEDYRVREHKEEDCTMFILGDELQCIEKDKFLFPVMSHA